MSNTHLIEADLSDTGDLLRVYSAALEKKLSHNDTTWGSLDEPFTYQEVEDSIKTGSYYKIVKDDQIVGAIQLGDRDVGVWGQPSGELYINKLAILPKYTGQGLGRTAIQLAEEMAKKKGLTGFVSIQKRKI